jgi:hypothetical protein
LWKKWILLDGSHIRKLEIEMHTRRLHETMRRNINMQNPIPKSESAVSSSFQEIEATLLRSEKPDGKKDETA